MFMTAELKTELLEIADAYAAARECAITAGMVAVTAKGSQYTKIVLAGNKAAKQAAEHRAIMEAMLDGMIQLSFLMLANSGNHFGDCGTPFPITSPEKARA